MNCCQCQGIEDLFDEKSVAQELAQYRKKGPSKTTRMLVKALKALGVAERTLLDIGGGVGAIQHELLSAGASDALDVDASQAYLQAARNEAARRGLADRIRFWHGNFVELADQIPPADIVTLDRVLCCYDDVNGLVDRSAALARRLYGLVYPRNRWWIQLAVKGMNLLFRLQKNPYRAFAHPSELVEALVTQHGLRRVYLQETLVWQVVVYARA